MVRCDIPCCNDEWCRFPYPTDPGYDWARIARNERMREGELAAQIEREKFNQILQKTPELNRNKNNLLVLNDKPIEVISCSPPELILGYTETEVFRNILLKGLELKAEAFEKGPTKYIKRKNYPPFNILNTREEYYSTVQYYKLTR